MSFAGRRKTGRLDLEAVEMAWRSGLHQGGALALTQLLRFDPPDAEQSALPCRCGHTAAYRGLRSKPVLTVLGWVRIERPYFLCAHCHRGQFPADLELDVEDRKLSPGVRRMAALVGEHAPFDHGRQQMQLLAGLEVTAKAVERTSEAIGEEIAGQERQSMQQAMQLNLPIPIGPRIATMYVEMDGTGVPMVAAETAGRKEGERANRLIPARSNWVACSRRRRWMRNTVRSRIPMQRLTAEPLRGPKSSDAVCSAKRIAEFGAGRKPKLSWPMARSGFGLSPTCTFRERFRSSIFITPGSISGTWPRSRFPTSHYDNNAGLAPVRSGWTTVGSKAW